MQPQREYVEYREPFESVPVAVIARENLEVLLPRIGQVESNFRIVRIFRQCCTEAVHRVQEIPRVEGGGRQPGFAGGRVLRLCRNS